MSACVRCGDDPGFPVAICGSCGYGGNDLSAQGASSGAATVIASGRPRASRPGASPDATVIERGGNSTVAADAYLFVREGPDKGRQVAIGESVTIGRDPDNTLSVRDKRVSGKHALIRRTRQGFVFQDLLGTNGTYYFGPAGELRLTAPHRLSDGDRLRMGHTVIQFIGAEER